MEERRTTEVALEHGRIESGRYDNDFEIGSPLLQDDIPKARHDEVGVGTSLMGFVDDDAPELRQQVVSHELGLGHAIRHVHQTSVGAGFIVKPDVISDFLAEFGAH